MSSVFLHLDSHVCICIHSLIGQPATWTQETGGKGSSQTAALVSCRASLELTGYLSVSELLAISAHTLSVDEAEKSSKVFQRHTLIKALL